MTTGSRSRSPGSSRVPRALKGPGSSCRLRHERFLRERKRATSVTSFWNTAVVHDPMMFTDPENWAGGFYELSLEVGDRDDDRLQRALTALWRAAAITDCYGSRDREPADQIAVPITVASLEEFGHLQGIARPSLGARRWLPVRSGR